MRLRAKRAATGVDALLKGEGALSSLLVPYTRTIEVQGLSDAELALEQHLRAVRADIARVKWAAVVKPDQRRVFSFGLHARTAWSMPPDVKVSVRPISLPDTYLKVVTAGTIGLVADFPGTSFEALTSFFAIKLEAKLGVLSAEETFVVNAPIEGAPENRIARVLNSLLDNPAKVLLFLRLLLAMDPFEVMDALDPADDAPICAGNRQMPSLTETPLLEAMLRALAQEPVRLDAITQVVADLVATSDGRGRLPPGFLAAWEPIQKARETLKGNRR